MVESTGFEPFAAGLASDFDPNGLGADVPGSEQKRLVERYTLGEDGQKLFVEYTIEDPVYLTEPYTGRTDWIRLSDDTPIHKFECDPDIATRTILNAAESGRE